ncbi:class I adenylate-forming enzyme family protein [Phytohabitans suffuscus]
MDDRERLASLTAPGGAFPLVRRSVGGVTVEVFDRGPRTLREAFLATRRHGDREAIVYRDDRYTYADQWAIVVTLAHRLRDKLGVVKGDRVAIAMRNYPEFAFAFWAAQLLGAVAVPLNAWLKAAEMTELVRETAPKVLFADRERVDQLRGVEGVGALVGVRCSEAPLDYTDLLDLDHALDTPPDCDVEPDDLATILFTSGTTGRPKGAPGTHLNHAASLLNKLIRAVSPPDRPGGEPLPPTPSVKLLTFPFFHIAGINNLYSNAYSGHRTVLMYKWDAREALRLVEVERVGEMSGPPFVVQTFLAAAATSERDLSSLRSLGMGGAPAPKALIQEIHEIFGGRVSPRTGYGLTETTSGVFAISGADFVARPDSVGRPLPTVEVRIEDGTGRPVPAGAEGEVALRGPQVVAGYCRTPSQDNFVDGWFRTGDLGRLDPDGYLYLVGRLKDVVIRGGENINCAEVEACLATHPDVVEAVVFGLPHPTLGEELAAIVRLLPASTTDAATLRAYAAERLAAFKVPAKLAISPTPIPRTPSGKIIKRHVAAAMDFDKLLAGTV